jgi:hypothetical protein
MVEKIHTTIKIPSFYSSVVVIGRNYDEESSDLFFVGAFKHKIFVKVNTRSPLSSTVKWLFQVRPVEVTMPEAQLERWGNCSKSRWCTVSMNSRASDPGRAYIQVSTRKARRCYENENEKGASMR